MIRRWPTPAVFALEAASVGEGPVVDELAGTLVWVDIPAGALHISELASGLTETTRFPTQLGAVAPRAHTQGYAAAMSDGFAIIDGPEMMVFDPVLADPNLRMNDAKCDALGRMWAGSTTLEFEPGQGALHCWEGSSPSRQALDGLTLPNGIGWSPDSTHMYLVDSMAHVLLSAPFDLDDGVAGEFKTLAKIDSGLPDGLCVAEDGSIWVAVCDGGEVVEFSPGGEVVGRIEMPVSKPTSCALSASGVLYVTSARLGLNEADLARQPNAGCVFAVDIGVGPVAVAAFAG